MIYYAKIEDAPLYDLSRQVIIKSGNQLMMLSDSIWKDYPDTDRITGAYIVFYQGGKIDHCTYVTGPVYQSSAESEYNSELTAGMDLSHFMMRNKYLAKKDPDVVPEQEPLIILDSKSCVFMVNNGKYTKHTIHIFRIMHVVRNVEDWNIHKKVWCEGGLKFSDIGTRNFREDKLNTRLGYAMVILENWQSTFTGVIIGYRRLLKTICSEWIDWTELNIRLNEFEMFIWVYNDELEFIMTKITLKTVI